MYTSITMKSPKFGSFVLFCLAAAPLLADTEFTVRRMTRNDVPLGRGQCDIRLQVDNEAEVTVRGDRVYIRTISGRDARDDGSECNEPFPPGNPRGFNYEVRDSRGDIAMLGSPRNGVTVRIRDSAGGEGRYHFRLSWDLQGGGFPGGGGGGGFGRPDRDDGFGRPRAPTAFTVDRAMDICREEVRRQVQDRYRYDRVDFRRVRADDQPGRNDYIIGEVMGYRRRDIEEFNFVCRVDFSSGRVRDVDVRRR